jgi:hypothetical protein
MSVPTWAWTWLHETAEMAFPSVPIDDRAVSYYFFHESSTNFGMPAGVRMKRFPTDIRTGREAHESILAAIYCKVTNKRITP